LALSTIPIFLPGFIAGFTDSQTPGIIVSIIGIIICSVYLATAAHSLRSISDYGSFSFSDFFSKLRIAWPAGIVMGLFVFLIFMILTVVIPFYLSMESPLGLVLAALVFWVMIFALLSFQFYFTVCARLNTNLKKAFKKCMIISFDNSGFALFTLIYNLIAMIISIILAFMFPGPAGVLLFLDQGLRLRLLKYDWLEANPDANRRKIPWDVLLIEEREKTGTRSFRNFIFPWKD
jgi:uncharacterized membrane protein YesL